MIDFRQAAGAHDVEGRAAELASMLPPSLQPLARVAYDYRWSWLPGGEAVFEEIAPLRWRLSARNPVRFLSDLWPSAREWVERTPEMRGRIQWLAEAVETDAARPLVTRAGVGAPIVFMSAEFGVHPSLPIYSGGLGVLAGDILKEASDQKLPLLAIGLFYRRGYFHQRLDLTGRQLEYWTVNDPKSLPLARVSVDGEPLRLSVDVFGATTWFQVWRVNVGTVPLLLLDTEVPENDLVQRWTTARLYEGNSAVRLAQYALLGIGGARVLRALGIDATTIHLNEGHPALATLELAAEEVARGVPLEEALAAVRQRVVFTTHTPVPAGNETYGRDELLAAYSELPARLGLDDETFTDLFRALPGDASENPGMTPLAIRMSRRRNGVSQLHGQVARAIWQPMFTGLHPGEVPITHVTNGAHLPTFISPAFKELFDRHLRPDWLAHVGDPATWEAVYGIPDEELWAARNAARHALIDYTRAKSELDRLQRGEQIDYVRGAARALDPDVLTLGFARRLATYKRVYLLTRDPERALRLITGTPPLQLLVAGKAHPQDEGGKATLQGLFTLKRRSETAANRMVVLEDYDLSVARHLVAGCDVWVNLPRRPMEASGTSGMKATFNGALQLSVLDGWWAEGYDGENGWAIPGDGEADPDVADTRDAEIFYRLLEQEVVPLFYDRGTDGIPHGWCARVKLALATCAWRFSSARMLNDYVDRIYRHTNA
jgi:starch phosphorylase